MKRNIQSLVELNLAIDKLTAEKLASEKLIKNYISDYAASLKPANLVKSAFSSIKNDPEIGGMLKSKGVEAAIGFVVSQLLFKNTNPLLRTAATVLGTSFASNIFGSDSAGYVEKIKRVYQKFRSRKKEPGSDLFNEEDIYEG